MRSEGMAAGEGEETQEERNGYGQEKRKWREGNLHVFNVNHSFPTLLYPSPFESDWLEAEENLTKLNLTPFNLIRINITFSELSFRDIRRKEIHLYQQVQTRHLKKKTLDLPILVFDGSKAPLSGGPVRRHLPPPAILHAALSSCETG